VLADASGAHLFPALLAVALAYGQAAVPLDRRWLATAGVWALAYGLRGILWHQLADAENDRAAAVRTFVQRRGTAFAARLGARVVFPLELAGLAALLWQIASPVPLVALALYALLVYRRVKKLRVHAIVVQPRPPYLILLQEYYGVLLPAALLLLSAFRHPGDLAVCMLHLVLFPRGVRWMVSDVRKLR
jgi:hypothetical protein